MAKTKHPKYRATFNDDEPADEGKVGEFIRALGQHIRQHGLPKDKREEWRKRPRKKVLKPPTTTGRKPPDQTEE